MKTLDKIQERKNEKTGINNSRTLAEKFKAQAEYTEAKKQIKKSIKADNQKYVEKLVTTVEKAAREGNMKRLHNTTKKPGGEFSITLLSIPGKVFNRVLLNRMKDTLDAQLRDQQAGFRKDRLCTDQIATLWIIVEQSVEWNSSLYINFIDYEKAFDSVDRRALWRLLRHYGVPEIVNIIRNSYGGLQCKVMHEGQITDAFQPIKIGGEDLEDVKPCTYLGSIIDEHGGSDADVKTRIGSARAAYLQLKNIWNSKQLSVNQHQCQNFQYKCQDSSTVWGRNLENYESHHPEDTRVYEQLSRQNTSSVDLQMIIVNNVTNGVKIFENGKFNDQFQDVPLL
ncbi:unnamed protein product [Schistosoma curassoni]|uniref:Reverse transcriptase domain-containing protein n=1 Tax=Schistosoma curassoni TaxID=6186 RepID=A0A183K8U0_9TREM|nr:unnamed protein product [Schistosoma curassoni]